MAKIGPEFLPRSDREGEYYKRAHAAFEEAVEHGTKEETEAAWRGYEHALEEMPLNFKRKEELSKEEKALIQRAERLNKEAAARGVSLSPSDFLDKWAALLAEGNEDARELETPKQDRPLTERETADLRKSVEDEMEVEAEELTKKQHKK